MVDLSLACRPTVACHMSAGISTGNPANRITWEAKHRSLQPPPSLGIVLIIFILLLDLPLEKRNICLSVLQHSIPDDIEATMVTMIVVRSCNAVADDELFTALPPAGI